MYTEAYNVPCQRGPNPPTPPGRRQITRARSGCAKIPQRRPTTRPAAPPAPATALGQAPRGLKRSLGHAARASTTSCRPPACARTKRAVRVSGGAGRAGNVRGVRGVVWYDGRRVSAFEGPAAHPLVKCTATSGDISRPAESQNSCQRGEGSEGITEVNGHMAGKGMCGTRAREGQGPRVIPILPAQLAAPGCAPVCDGRRT